MFSREFIQKTKHNKKTQGQTKEKHTRIVIEIGAKAYESGKWVGFFRQLLHQHVPRELPEKMFRGPVAQRQWSLDVGTPSFNGIGMSASAGINKILAVVDYQMHGVKLAGNSKNESS